MAKNPFSPYDRVKNAVYKGKKIFHIDFSYCNHTEILQVIAVASKSITVQPQKSLLLLTNLECTEASPQTIKALTEFASNNGPFVKASAVIGLGGIQNTVLNIFNKNAKREITYFGDLIKAKDWLIQKE